MTNLSKNQANDTIINNNCQDILQYNNQYGDTCSQNPNTVTVLKAYPKFDKKTKKYKPANMVKTLSIQNGNKTICDYDDGYFYEATIKYFDNINDLYRIIESTAGNEAFIRGGVIDDRNSKKILRRKRPRPEKQELATLMGVPLSWFMLDLDAVPFEVFDIKPGTALSKYILKRISLYVINTYFPELKGCSFIAQFSNSTDFGPKQNKIGLHLFFLLTKPLYNYQLKGFAKKLNEKSTLKIDTSLYNCAQVHYVASPIFEGIEDHIPDRNVLIKQEFESLNSNIILEANPEIWLSQPSKKSTQKLKTPSKKPSNKSINNDVELLPWNTFTCQNQAVEAIKKLDSNLHLNMRAGYNWLFRKYPDSNGSKLEKAFKSCPRAKQEEWAIQGHFETVSEALKSGAKTIVAQQTNINARRVINKTTSCFIDTIATKTEKRWVNELDGAIDMPRLEEQIVIALVAGYGVGKTKSLLEFIERFTKQYNRTPKILYIGSKRSIIADACGRLGLTSYKEANELSLSIGTTINSCKDFNGKFDLVVIDEIDEALKQLKGTVTNLGERHEILDHLAKLIKNNNHIVLMQDLMSTNIQYLLKMAGKLQQVKIVQSTIKRFAGLQVYIAPTKGVLQDKLYQDCQKLNNNLDIEGRIVIPCSSNSQTLRLQRIINKEYSNLEILVINKKTVNLPDVQEFLQNPTEISNKYHVIIYSPSISTGVSLENPLFTKTFGFHKNSPGTGGPLDFTQSLFRNRLVKEMFIFIDGYTTSEPENLDSINKAFAQAHEISLTHITEEGLFKPIETPTPTDCSVLEMHYQAEHGFLKNNSYQVIKWILGEHMECNLLDMDKIQSDKEKQIVEQEKVVKEEIKIQEQEELVATKTPSLEMAIELEKNHERTPEEEREFYKFTIEQSLGQPKLDEMDKEGQITLIDFQEKHLGAIKDWELAGLSKLQVTLLANYYMENLDSRNPNQLILAKHYFINRLLKDVFGITISGTDIQLTPDYGYRIDMLNLMPIKDLIVGKKELFNYLKLGTNIKGDVLTGNNISSLSKRFLIERSKRTQISTQKICANLDFFEYSEKGLGWHTPKISERGHGYYTLDIDPLLINTLKDRQNAKTSARVKLALRLEKEYLEQLKNNENLSVLKFLKSIKGSKTIFDGDIMEAVEDFTVNRGLKKIRQPSYDNFWAQMNQSVKEGLNINQAYDQIEQVLIA